MFNVENITSPKAISRAMTIDAYFIFLALDLWTKFDHIPIMADKIYTNTTIKIMMLTFYPNTDENLMVEKIGLLCSIFNSFLIPRISSSPLYPKT